MSRYQVRVQCGHPGCAEYSFYAADTRKEQSAIFDRLGNGKFRCVRHARPDEVLSAANPKRVTDMASRQEPYGRYWGNSDFVYGLGFKAFAGDFPAGTIIRVTAEIILPAEAPNAR